MKSIKIIILTVSVTCILAIAAVMNLLDKRTIKDLQTIKNNSGFAIVELYTSEGCSSCPPAEKLIEKIQKDIRNKQIYIMAFHVDYWDRQGWKDRFSDPEFSERHRKYAGWLNFQTLYTPQFVINGKNEYVGSDQRPILKAISTELKQETANILKLNCRVEQGKIKVEYKGAGNEKDSEIVLALIQKSAQSNVMAGENSGKNLSHVQIVRQLFHFDINNRENIAIYPPEGFNEKDWEIIGFVQHKTDGHITSAARFDFKS